MKTRSSKTRWSLSLASTVTLLTCRRRRINSSTFPCDQPLTFPLVVGPMFDADTSKSTRHVTLCEPL